MTTTAAPCGGIEVFPPFREPRADKKIHYTSSGSRALQMMSNNANSSSASNSRNVNNGMMMQSSSHTNTVSPSTTTEGDYEASGSVLSQPYPFQHTDSSSRHSRLNANSNRNHANTTNGSAASSRTGVRSTQKSFDTATMDDNGAKDIILEEKRRRAHGDGYTIHQYLRGRMLGKGGFAKVYLCTALDTGKNYAVKVVPKANLVKARARQKLQAEIKIHRTLKHKNICQYKHYFEDRTNCYILLELCRNQSMNEMIKRRKRLTEPEAAYFMTQLLESTRYMHDQSVIHRDLKLGNLFLDQNMCIKVGDLGLATRVEDRDEKRKTICGTPNYIAPEIIQGDKSKRGHSFEVDIWSIGVILYTVLVGKPPYEAKDVKATYQRILANEYSFPSHIRLSPQVKDLISSMLKSNPKDRPSLDFIEGHPFLTENIIPDFLPNSVLHRAPVWTLNEFGALVCDDEAPVVPSGKPSIPRSSSNRLPFASRNPNMPKRGPGSSASQPSKQEVTKPAERQTIDLQRVVKSAMTMASNTAKKAASSPAFKIFDESKSSNDTPSEIESRVSSARPTLLDTETIVTRTKALSIAASPEIMPPPPSTTALSPAEVDAEILRDMVEQLDTVLGIANARKGSYRLQSPRSTSQTHGPSKWVTRYVDYTSKYGLGFLLNDGGSGVYFNDSTKTALERDGDTFQYIERKKDDADPTGRRAESIIETYSLMAFPDCLKKKVTLLTHFRNYLIEQQKKAAEDGDDEISTYMGSHEDDNDAEHMIYVKKWIQTKHAILFRLSDQTVQVVFYDQTEVLMTPDTRYVTYVDKQRKRSTYALTDELVGTSMELEKRLKYTKEIVSQLLSGQRR